jgi:hypothetical protein
LIRLHIAAGGSRLSCLRCLWESALTLNVVETVRITFNNDQWFELGCWGGVFNRPYFRSVLFPIAIMSDKSKKTTDPKKTPKPLQKGHCVPRPSSKTKQ